MRYGSVVVGSAVLAGACLVGCSSGGGVHRDSQISHPVPISESAAPAAGPRVVVNGTVRSVENQVECVTAAEMTFVNIGSDNDGIAARLTAGERPSLESLTLGVVDGQPVTYRSSNGGAKPTVTKSGLSYKIAGPATAGLSTPATFELEFTCPAR